MTVGKIKKKKDEIVLDQAELRVHRVENIRPPFGEF
jgi:hypothetical protein